MLISPATMQSLLSQLSIVMADIGDDPDPLLKQDMLEGATSLDDVLSRLICAERMARFKQSGAKAALQSARNHFDSRIQSAGRQQAAAREMIRTILTHANIVMHKLPEGTVSLVQGRESLVLEEGFVPPQGYAITVPDREAIAATLKAGATIPGASMVSGKPFVMVR